MSLDFGLSCFPFHRAVFHQPLVPREGATFFFPVPLIPIVRFQCKTLLIPEIPLHGRGIRLLLNLLQHLFIAWKKDFSVLIAKRHQQGHHRVPSTWSQRSSVSRMTRCLCRDKGLWQVAGGDGWWVRNKTLLWNCAARTQDVCSAPHLCESVYLPLAQDLFSKLIT